MLQPNYITRIKLMTLSDSVDKDGKFDKGGNSDKDGKNSW